MLVDTSATKAILRPKVVRERPHAAWRLRTETGGAANEYEMEDTFFTIGGIQKKIFRFLLEDVEDMVFTRL